MKKRNVIMFVGGILLVIGMIVGSYSWLQSNTQEDCCGYCIHSQECDGSHRCHMNE